MYSFHLSSPTLKVVKEIRTKFQASNSWFGKRQQGVEASVSVTMQVSLSHLQLEEN